MTGRGETGRNTVLVVVAVVLASMLVQTSRQAGALTTHAPIRITSNAEFDAANGVTGGSGIPTDPYVIEGWEFNGSFQNSIEIRDTDAYFVIRDIYVHHGFPFDSAIYFWNVTNGNVETSRVSENRGDAVYVRKSANIVVRGNDIYQNSGDGVTVYQCFGSSTNVVVEMNDLSNNSYNLDLAYSDGVTVSHNNMSNSNGVHAIESTNITFTGNKQTNEGVHFIGDFLPQFNSHTLVDNQVNGLPLYYHKDCSNLTVDRIPVGELIVANCTNVKVANLTITDTTVGIEMAFVDGGYLHDNNLARDPWGMYLDHPSKLAIARNRFSDSHHGDIYIGHSSDIVATNNDHFGGWVGVNLEYASPNTTIENSNFAGGYYGILCFGHNVTMANNTFTSNGWYGIKIGYSTNFKIADSSFSVGWGGIYIGQSSRDGTVKHNRVLDREFGIVLGDATLNVVVTGNTLQHNGHGVYLQDAVNALVHHNNFLSNVMQAYDLRGPDNRWDIGCPGGGNYWSDYSGLDQRDCVTGLSNSDGLGDMPYVIDADSQDNYPLMSPPTDMMPPEMFNATISGDSDHVVPLSRLEPMTFQATADDSRTGGSTIFSANFTKGRDGWASSTPMVAEDGAFDEVNETIRATISPPSVAGTSVYCAYATDSVWNENTTGVCARLTIVDDLPPQIRDVRIDGQPTRQITPATLSVLLEAAVDDSATGGSIIGGANFTSPARNWGSSQPMIPVDTIDSDVEAFSITIDTSSLSAGTYQMCVYGWDIVPNRNATGACAILIVQSTVISGPVTTLTIGTPNHTAASIYIKSSTPLDFSVVDRSGDGIRNTTYNLDGAVSINYTATGTFFLAGEGEHVIEWRSLDRAGNLEDVSSMALTVDDTPPTTTITQTEVQAATETVITLPATDSGCGVNVTMYRIDGGGWTVYTGGFTLAEGEHTIYYYSIDKLGNVEQERSLVVRPEVAVNYKPIVALVFAIILAVVGLWSSKRKPWKGGKEKMGVVKAFAFTSLPFVLAEAGTGVVSLLTGQLSIPPALGFGTAVDLGILAVGLVVALAGVLKKEEMEAAAANEPENR